MWVVQTRSMETEKDVPAYLRAWQNLVGDFGRRGQESWTKAPTTKKASKVA